LLSFDMEPLERALRQAELALEQAQRQLDRANQLLDRNAITLAERLDAQTQRDLAEINLATAQSALADATVRAPFAGVVQQVMVQAQDRVSVNEPLLHLVSTRDLEVVALLPASQAALLQPEMQAQLVLERQNMLSLTLERQDPVQAGGSLRLYFSGNLDGQVVGTFFPVRLALAPVPEVVVLPLRSLYDNHFVYRVNGQALLERIAVEVEGFKGAGEQQQVLVRSPELASGDAILTTRLRNASQGLPVLVQEPLQ
jgi:RND family efflux transporter MFP subunit